MTLGTVFHFFINQFIRMVVWAYNLPLPIGEDTTIPLGSLILSFFTLGLIILIYNGYFGWSSDGVSSHD